MADSTNWWPGSKSLIGLTPNNFAELYTNSIGLYNTGGIPTLLCPKNDWPYFTTQKINITDLSHQDWSDGNIEDFLPIDQTLYNTGLSDADAMRKSRCWNILLNSIDTSSERFSCINQTLANAKLIAYTYSDLANYQGFHINIPNGILTSGLILSYRVTNKTGTFNFNGHKYKIETLRAAYEDVWKNVKKYYELNNIDYLPDTLNYWMIIAHTDNKLFNKKFDGLDNRIDLLSKKSGMQYTNQKPSYNLATALSATKDDWEKIDTTVDDVWFHLGISQGDNFPGSISETRGWAKECRVWGIENSSEKQISAYAGTISNGMLLNEFPEINCLSVIPSFVAIPELLQCIKQSGPAWDAVKTSLEPDEISRLPLRHLILAAEFSTITIDKLIITDANLNKKVAIPAAGLPAAGMQYGILVSGKIDAALFPQLDYQGSAIWPGNDNSTYPTIHVRCFNPVEPEKGFAHSFPIRLDWYALNHGRFFDQMTGATSGTLGGTVAALDGFGTVLAEVTYMGYHAGLKGINAVLMGKKSIINKNIYYSDTGLIFDETKDDLIAKTTANKWGDKETNNTIAVWNIWPSSFTSVGGMHYFTRGPIQINFRAKTSVHIDECISFLEFQFFTVPVGSGTPYTSTSDFISKIIFTNHDTDKFEKSMGQTKLSFVIPDKSPGRTLYWEKEASNFSSISQSSRILSPSLSQDFIDYSLNLYIDDMFSSTKTSTNQDVGKYFDMSHMVIIVSVKAHYIQKTSTAVPEISLDLQNNSIKMPAKLIQSGFVGLDQRFYNKFSPPYGGTPLSTLKAYVPPPMEEQLINNEIYDKTIVGYPNINEVIQLSTLNDTSKVTKFDLPITNIQNISTKTDAEIRSALSIEKSAYFVIPENILQNSFILGEPDKYWKLSFNIEKIHDEKNAILSLSSLNTAILLDVFYIFPDNKPYEIMKNYLFRTTMQNSQTFSVDIGPFVSDITMLRTACLMITIKIAGQYDPIKYKSGFLQINKNSFELDHKDSICSVLASPPTGDVKGGRHIDYYRNLPIVPVNTLGSQEINFVLQDVDVKWISNNADFNFLGVALSPIMNFPLRKEFGWVLDYTGIGVQNLRVALIKGGAIGEKDKAFDATAFPGAGTKISFFDTLQNIGYILQLFSNTDANYELVELNYAGNDILFDDIAFCISGDTNHRIKAYRGIIIATKNNISDIYSFYSSSDLERINIKIDESKTEILRLKNLNNFNITWNFVANCYSVIARHVDGQLVNFNISQNLIIGSQINYIDGFINKTNDPTVVVNNSDYKIEYVEGPMNLVSKGYYDARGGSLIADTDCGSIDERVGVSVSNGKPAIICDRYGGLLSVFSYDKHFSLYNGVESICSPFLGRVYATYSLDGGARWTPPICILNLSPFNVNDTTLTYSYLDMVKYLDNYRGRYENATKYKYTDLILNNLSDEVIDTIAIEDLDLEHNSHLNKTFMSFWYGGYVCYLDISQYYSILNEMWSVLKATKYSVNYNYAAINPGFEYIYSNKLYTRLFWDPLIHLPINIVAGPIDNIITKGKIGIPLPNPGNENIADSLLKANSLLLDLNATSIYYDTTGNPYTASVRYNEDLEGVTPCNVNIVFNNANYKKEQPPGKISVVMTNDWQTSLVWKNNYGKPVIAHIPTNKDVIGTQPFEILT
jgi:hypothetical protein